MTLSPRGDRHSTFIPSSLIMKPMAIGGPLMSPPRGSSSATTSALYQRYRQRTPIIAASVVVVLLLVVHSVPRRKALVQHHEAQSDLYDVFDQDNVMLNEEGGGEGDASTPQHDMPWREGEIPSDVTSPPLSEPAPPIDAEQSIQDATSDIAISSDAVSLGDEYDDLPFLHCGPEYGSLPNPGDGAGRELLLLHGAAFRASTWEESGILEGLCLLGKQAASDASAGTVAGDLSVTALDLPVSADALYLNQAFKALWERGIISGEATYIVTPSASGSAMMSAASFAASKDQDDESSKMDQSEDVSKILSRMVRGWIPVAAGAVLSASRQAIGIFIDLEIPILAIYGDQDAKGKDSSNRLSEEAGAWTLELEGRHPCYLDSPSEFIRAVIDFIDNGGRVDAKRYRS